MLQARPTDKAKINGQYFKDKQDTYMALSISPKYLLIIGAFNFHELFDTPPPGEVELNSIPWV